MTEQDKVLIAFTTCPSIEVADRIARVVVEERFAACVNRLPSILSTYIWNGAVQADEEVLLMFKTTSARVDALKARVIALHPYELPEFIAVAVCAGVENYLAWVRDSVKSP